MPTKDRKPPRAVAGEGRPYFEKARGTYCCTYPLGTDERTGKRVRKYFRGSTPKAAADARREWLKKRADNEVDRQGPTAEWTLAAWLTYWHARIVVPRSRPKTCANYLSTINNHLAPSEALAGLQIDQVKAHHVRDLLDEVRAKKGRGGRPMSEGTVRLVHDVLHLALRDARIEDILTGRDLLATERVPKPAPAISQRRPLSSAEAVHLLAHLDPKDLHASRWATALLTGARQGELLGLERDRVYSDHISLEWQLQHLATDHGCTDGAVPAKSVAPCGYERAAYCPSSRIRHRSPRLEYRHVTGALYLTRPKSKKGIRTVPLVEPIRTIVDLHLQATSGGTWGLTWTKPDGDPIDPRGDQKAWKRLLAAAGLEHAPLHSARGVPATRLAALGVGDAVRTSMMGWATIRSADPYERAEEAAKTAAMKAMVESFGAADALAHLAMKSADNVERVADPDAVGGAAA